MRILHAGMWTHGWFTEHYIARAFERAEHAVERFDESRYNGAALVDKCRIMLPDVLLFHKLNLVGTGSWPDYPERHIEILGKLKGYCGAVVCWQFDLMLAPSWERRFEWAKKVAPHIDLFAATDGGAARLLPNGVVIRQGAPDDVDDSCPFDLPFTCDVLFLGSQYGDRVSLVQKLKAAFPAARFVNDARGGDLARIVRSARFVIGPHWPSADHYWSNRIYVVTGNGGLFAAPEIVGMRDEGWVPGVNYLALPSSLPEMIDTLQKTVRDTPPLAFEPIRRAGYEHAQGKCSYDARVAELLDKVNQCRR